MFRIKASDSYLWPVKGRRPLDGGKFEQFSFDMAFRRINETELAALVARTREGDLRDAEFVREIAVGFSGVQDAEGNEVPFSQQGLALLLNESGVPAACVTAFFESLPGARQKN